MVTSALPGSLTFADGSDPGVTRKQVRGKWAYFAPDGTRITDRDEIDRMNAIGMPPAYERCWFCPDPNGHIQAVGFDAKGRKQYRYHAGFREHQEDAKYELLAKFGRALPKLRRRVEEDITGRAMSRETVLAAVVRLIDTTHIRVGNEQYVKDNKSFGATTLRNRHAKVSGGKLMLSYVGKSGKKRTVTITDRNLVRIAKRTQDLPGQHLFEFIGTDGEPHPVTSNDVNAYIKDAMGDAFTAKNFRTWGASVIAFTGIADSADKKLKMKAVIEPVAEALGNTVAISRKSYVHPALIEALKDAGAIGGKELPRATQYLSRYERGLIEFLEALPSAEEKAELKTEEEAAARAEEMLEAVAAAG
ncbi:MAG TPA: DNA topoisomerase IB [Sphingomonadaceae bacterium]|jgi:DNA topoisomerase-1|nr:DNA topoisomerase IB [Sphingomonadaceae bacterium]